MKPANFYILLPVIILFLATCGNKKDNTSDIDLPEDKMSLKSVGLVYLEKNQLDYAESAFKKLIDLDPEDAIAYANLGLVFLRMGHYERAIGKTLKALEIDPDNAGIRLNLAHVYEHNLQTEQALEELEKIKEKNPEYARVYYSLANYYAKNGDSAGSLRKQETYLNKLVTLVPANIVTRLQLLEVLARIQKPDECLKHLDKLQEIIPGFSPASEEYLSKAKQLLHNGNSPEALRYIRLLHNFMNTTTAYISDIKEIRGPGGEYVGFPVISTSKSASTYSEDQNLIDIMKFTDASKITGLPFKEQDNNIGSATLSLTDYDGDGDIDIYFSYLVNGTTASNFFLFNNDLGSFTDSKTQAGLEHQGIEKFVTSTDYNNDGLIDLFVITKHSNLLYKNNGDGTYSNVTEAAGLNQLSAGNKAVFRDLDHDGDLDLFIANDGGNRFFRNNADGTFSERGDEMGLRGDNLQTLDIQSGDFDDDGDLDLFTVSYDGSNALFTNLRRSRFNNVTENSGLSSKGKSRTAAVADYNNDGMLDIFIAGDDGYYELYKNKGDGTFSTDTLSNEAFSVLDGVTAQDAVFIDFDNDGYEDLIVAGTTQQNDIAGVLLFHNDSLGTFHNVSYLLPETVRSGYKIGVGDFNEDGDLDFFLSGPEGIHLIRNDAGNMNNYIKVQLVGLSNGNGKNNRFGIGSKLELRAGNLYQMKTVTQPLMHFGLGKKENADILRIVWSNGVPQNIISPRSDQDLMEEQILKGSCPFLYTWNGEKYVFVKDMMWRSALGMPMGIMGDKRAYAFPDISKEYLKIPGEMLQPKEGKYSIKITEELWEAVYFDKVKLIAMDHPKVIDVHVDEKFVLPPFPGIEVFKVQEQDTPVSAVDGKGNDLLSKISEYDYDYVSNLERKEYQGITQSHELILDPGDNIDPDQLYLLMRGWIFPTDASINIAMAQRDKFQIQAPTLQMVNEDGDWETVIENMGFPLGKDKMVITNLSGRFLSADHRMKIITNMQIYWDHIFFSSCSSETQVKLTEIPLVKADLHFRGYSAIYRKGGQYGPHWFDYYEVEKGQKWRDLTGLYTRYGDVKPLLDEGDDQYIIANAGDEVTLEFSTEGLPDLPAEWIRDFLVYSEGWVKDGDLNTAYGQTVEPLPFRDMSGYPYDSGESYPNTNEHINYRKTYNTREVNTDQFKKALILK